MQLDNTLVVVRSRGLLELVDLAIVVLRNDFIRLVYWSLIGWLPWIVLDFAVLFPMASMTVADSNSFFLADEASLHTRFIFHLSALVVLQAPAASMPLCYYIGQRMFRTEPSTREVLQSCLRGLPTKIWVLGFARMALVAPVITFLVGIQYDYYPFWEIFVLGFSVLGFALFLRAIRPFATEVLALERSALQSSGTEKTPGNLLKHRMRVLHRPLTAENIGRFCAIAIIAFLGFAVLTLSEIWVFQLVMLGRAWNWYFSFIAVPFNLFIVSTYVAVFRFLSYIDSRILLEGWEVRLRFMSEAVRLHDT